MADFFVSCKFFLCPDFFIWPRLKLFLVQCSTQRHFHGASNASLALHFSLHFSMAIRLISDEQITLKKKSFEFFDFRPPSWIGNCIWDMIRIETAGNITTILVLFLDKEHISAQFFFLMTYWNWKLDNVQQQHTWISKYKWLLCFTQFPSVMKLQSHDMKLIIYYELVITQTSFEMIYC